MDRITPDEWHAHYRDGKTFRPLGDTERRLLGEHVPAPAGGLALDVGCGLGELARHLASVGYQVDAVDFAPAALDLARRAGEGVPGVRRAGDGVPGVTRTGEGVPGVTYHRFDIERDRLDDLPHPAYDLITFRLSWAFVHDRTRVLARLRERLRPGGTLCVITPVVGAVPEERRYIALDEGELEMLGAGWGVVERYDAQGLALVLLRDPVHPAEAGYADKGRPSPHALTGAGVVVTDPRGRVLLGWSVRGVWELPGGKNSAGEDFREAAVRELEEETGLKADPADARLLALLMDSVHGMPRLTAAVHVTAYTGEPAVTEPHLIHRWEWHDPADLPALPQPLFTPSAHVLDTLWPGLLPDLPPVHRYPVATEDQ